MTFRNGGWVVLLAVLVFLAGGIWQTAQLLDARTEPKPGDGEHVETYGFDLSTCAVPRELIAATSLPRDGMERLDFPPLMDVGTWREHWSKGRHRKYLVESDRVIGLVIDGVARAYPVRVLTWHEVVNDTLGGVPIVVTYAPLADGAVVLDRREMGDGGTSRETGDASAGPGGAQIAAADAPLVGFSGLVYNGCPLVYAGEPAALYSPIGLRAVTGGRAGDALTPLPAAVLPWSEWIEMHPHTEVVEPSLDFIERYRKDPYHNYYGNDLLEEYPVAPPLPEGERNKAQVLALVAGDLQRAIPFEALGIARYGDDDLADERTVEIGGMSVTVAVRGRPPSAWITSPDEGVVGVTCFRWAWHALHAGEAS